MKPMSPPPDAILMGSSDESQMTKATAQAMTINQIIFGIYLFGIGMRSDFIIGLMARLYSGNTMKRFRTI